MIIKRQPIVPAAIGLVILMAVRRQVRPNRRRDQQQPTGPRDPFKTPQSPEADLDSAVAPTRSSAAGASSRGPDAMDIGLEVPEADAIEQSQTVVAEDHDGDDTTGVPWYVSEADWLDQLRGVTLDDELRADEKRD